MKTRTSAIVICIAALAACGDVTERVTPSGRRIVSLSPAMTETIFALGAGEDVVGVSTFCDYPETVREARKSGRATAVGGLLDPAIETILKLKPTVIFAEKNTMSGKLDALRGLRLVELPNQTLDDAFLMMQAVGREVDKRAEADALVARIRQSLERSIGDLKPRVLLVYYADNPSSVECVGAPNWQSDILTRLGGVNVLADEAMVTPSLNAEHILQHDPDLVIEMHFTTDVTPVLERWGQLPLLRAVKLGDVHGIYGHEAGSTGPSLEIFIKRLREILEGWQQRQRARS